MPEAIIQKTTSGCLLVANGIITQPAIPEELKMRMVFEVIIKKTQELGLTADMRLMKIYPEAKIKIFKTEKRSGRSKTITMPKSRKVKSNFLSVFFIWKTFFVFFIYAIN
ncbi:MAG: hypothetical protein WA063_06595 [Minisyncoccia bacterium]